MVIIIDYLATTLFLTKYAKIYSNYYTTLPYPMIIITHHKHNMQ